MGLLKFANKEDVTRYPTPDGEDWIELRNTLTKGEMNSLFNSMPSSLVERAMVKTSGDDGEEDLAGTVLVFREAPEMSKALFAAYCKGWSLPVPVSLNAYLDLDPAASNWIDETLMAHSQRNDAQMTSAEGKQPRRSRRGSPQASEQTTS
jgi:hypothetical protein